MNNSGTLKTRTPALPCSKLKSNPHNTLMVPRVVSQEGAASGSSKHKSEEVPRELKEVFEVT